MAHGRMRIRRDAAGAAAEGDDGSARLRAVGGNGPDVQPVHRHDALAPDRANARQPVLYRAWRVRDPDTVHAAGVDRAVAS